MPQPTTAAAQHPDTGSARAAADARATSLCQAFERALGLPFTDGNTVRTLRNGQAIFPAMLDAIRAAQRSVRLLTFIYWTGDVARAFASALALKAREGVRVEVLLDAVGSLSMPAELTDAMQRAGVDVRRFRPIPKLHVHRIGNRTHRKVLVCDGTIGFTGGVGIAEEWEGDARDPSEWRDTHFELRGPAVRALEGAFLDNWLEAGGPLTDVHPDELAEAFRRMPPTSGQPCTSSAAVQVVRSHGLSEHSDMRTTAELLLHVARRRLRIQTAYFVPDEGMVASLVTAAERGVEVEVMLPGDHTDHRLCNLAGRAEFATLLDAGVRVQRYQRTMLHTKVVTVDGLLACVGSPNFNHRSMRRDDEIALNVLDPNVTATLDAHFEDDLEHCEPIDPARWPKRGRWARAREAFAALFRHNL